MVDINESAQNGLVTSPAADPVSRPGAGDALGQTVEDVLVIQCRVLPLVRRDCHLGFQEPHANPLHKEFPLVNKVR